jgi:hypothetical protein
MLFKGSNNLVQIYRSFSITGNYGYRHPNSEARNDEIQNVQREVNMDFYFVGITF